MPTSVNINQNRFEDEEMNLDIFPYFLFSLFLPRKKFHPLTTLRADLFCEPTLFSREPASKVCTKACLAEVWGS